MSGASPFYRSVDKNVDAGASGFLTVPQPATGSPPPIETESVENRPFPRHTGIRLLRGFGRWLLALLARPRRVPKTTAGNAVSGEPASYTVSQAAASEYGPAVGTKAASPKERTPRPPARNGQRHACFPDSNLYDYPESHRTVSFASPCKPAAEARTVNGPAFRADRTIARTRPSNASR